MDTNTTAPGTCSCKHHKLMPILIILLGLTFLLADINILTWSAANVIWPILVIIGGASKFCKCCGK